MSDNRPISLDGPWQFRAVAPLRGDVPAEISCDKWMPAVVPGTVHYQLQQNGKISDPWFGRNELQLQWIDQQDWEWATRFVADAPSCQVVRQELIFDGLDTVATIYLNGREIGRSANMFRQIVCDVRGILKVGPNELRVLLRSPTAFAQEEFERGGRRVPLGEFRWQTGECRSTGRAWIRKVQCHFGWDWGVFLATSGIWQPVRLECGGGARLTCVQIEQEHIGPPGAPSEVRLHVTARFDSPVARRGSLRLHCDGQTVETHGRLTAGENSATASLVIAHPRLWWPSGSGEAHLYQLEVEWEDESGEIQRRTRRIGLRTVELVRKPDRAPDGSPAESFFFQINGRPIYAKGANWIPPDQFVERCTPPVYRHLLGSMVEANMNIVRVWGGGWYEQDIFYELCDELGLMVWQDFMMACALYPYTDTFLEELTAEARYQVRRLHTHPSIVLWCGDNENATAVWEWWRKTNDFQKNVEIYKAVMTALRGIVLAEDSTRPFWLSSPSNDEFGEHPGDPNRGDVHYWDVWHKHQPFGNYLTVRPRFASEFGFQSFPESRTIRPVVPPGELNPSSRVMEHHQRSLDGNMLITNTMAREMRIPKDFDSFCWVSQINQAMAVRTAVEHWRRLRPWCMGTIFWQLNDLWPVASWSSIDYHGRWKVLQHFAARFYAPLLASLIASDNRMEIWATSDHHNSLELQGELELFTWNGQRIAQRSVGGGLQPGESRRLAELPLTELLDGKAESHEVCAFVRLTGGELTSENFAALVPWKWVTLPRPEIETSLRQNEDRLELLVQSEQVIPFFHAELENLEGHFQGDWQILRPGSQYVMRWVPHIDRGAAAPSLADARNSLRMFSLWDSYEHE